MGRDASRNWEWGTSRRKAGAGMEEETHSGVVGGPPLGGSDDPEIQEPVMSREEVGGRGREDLSIFAS